MKLKVALFSFAFIMCFLTQNKAQQTARVVRVKDGDTYVFQNGGRLFTVRLTKIDAPEIKQNGGHGAYQFVSSLINGKIVEYDSTGKDKYGRVLVSAKLNGKRLDSFIIRNGWAWHYLEYDNEPMLTISTQEAIRDRLGLWKCGVDKVCPPWLWRGYNSRNRLRYCKGCKSIF